MRLWLARLLSFIAAFAILATVGTWVFNQTVGNAGYLQRKATETKLSAGLSAGLPALIGTNIGANPAQQALLSQAMSPAFIDSQLQTILPQLVAHYREGAAAPSFDTKQLTAQAAALGVTLPPEVTTRLDQAEPVVAPGQADTTVQAATRQADQLQWVAPLAAVILLVLIVLLAGHHRWFTLAGTFFTSGIGVLILAGLAQLPPRLLASTLETSPAKPLAGPVRQYAEAIAHDQTQLLLWSAAGLGAAAVICVILHYVFRVAHKFGHLKPGGHTATPPGH